MTFFLAGIATLLAAAVLQAAVPRPLRLAFFAFVTVAGLIAAGTGALMTLLNGTESILFTLPFPFERATLELDPLSAFFALTISLGGIAGTIYGVGYLGGYPERSLRGHLFAFALFLVSMLLVVTTRAVLSFLFAWELMSLWSLVLLFFDRSNDEVRDATINYFVAMHVAFALILTGFLLFMTRSGSGDFASFSAVMSDPSFTETALLILFAGFAIKAGFIPFHSWLPKAHPAAPSHVSGLMSGIMIKTGIYGILRFTLIVGVPTTRFAIIVLVVAIVSSVVGVLYALAQHDLKRLLAYSSIENIGIVGIGIGLSMIGMRIGNGPLILLGMTGALIHLVNHSLFKGLLFYGAGALYRATHTRDIDKLGGIIGRMPKTALLFIIGSVAIAGLPPLNGFIGEFVLYLSMLSGAPHASGSYGGLVVLTAGALALTGILALYCFTKACGIVFLGSPRSNAVETARDPGGAMIAGMTILAFAVFVIGLYPAPLFALAVTVAAGYPYPGDAAAAAMPVVATLGSVSRVLLLFILLFAFLYYIRNRLIAGGGGIAPAATWGCGYRHGTARMQYTASSYVSPLMTLSGRLLGLGTDLERPQGLFPARTAFRSHPHDLVDDYLIAPGAKLIRYLFSLLRWVQSGDMAQYILYGVLFLAAALVWIMGGN
ncbi:MAG TPA: proton-conducting transporter membrane subunit [bacterium]|nr:proton-conducting transporter membrane subunit [bacterium]